MSKCYVSAVLKVAANEVGYREKKSNSQLDDKTANAGNKNYTKYARDFDQKYPNWYNGKKNGFAWCDMFVDWCFLTAYGYENALRLLCQPEKSTGAGCGYSLGFYKNKGQFYMNNPVPGDQIFFGTSITKVTHTGIVEKVDKTNVYTIEGNSGDMVSRRTYSLNNSKIVGYGRPCYDVEPAKTTVPNSRVKAWQKACVADGYPAFKLKIDGYWGEQCEAAANKCVVKYRSFLGKQINKYINCTKIVQKAVGATVDGHCGKQTTAKIREFQALLKLTVDGCAGPQTIKAILGVK